MLDASSELEQKLRLLKEINQKRNMRDSHLFDSTHYMHTMDSQTKDSEAYIEETTLTRLQQHNGASPMTSHSNPTCLSWSISFLVALALSPIAMMI